MKKYFLPVLLGLLLVWAVLSGSVLLGGGIVQAETPEPMKPIHVKALVKTITVDAGEIYFERSNERYLYWQPPQDIDVIGAWLYVETDYSRASPISWTEGATSIDVELSLTSLHSNNLGIARCITTDWYVDGVLSGNHADDVLVMFPAGCAIKCGPSVPHHYLFLNVCALNEAMAEGYFYCTVKVMVYYTVS